MESMPSSRALPIRGARRRASQQRRYFNHLSQRPRTCGEDCRRRGCCCRATAVCNFPILQPATLYTKSGQPPPLNQPSCDKPRIPPPLGRPLRSRPVGGLMCDLSTTTLSSASVCSLSPSTARRPATSSSSKAQGRAVASGMVRNFLANGGSGGSLMGDVRPKPGGGGSNQVVADGRLGSGSDAGHGPWSPARHNSGILVGDAHGHAAGEHGRQRPPRRAARFRFGPAFAGT